MNQRAARSISRLVAATGHLSFPNALTDGSIALQPGDGDEVYQSRLKAAARRDSQIKDEALAIARDHQWTVNQGEGPGEGHEAWPRLAGAKLQECLPRIHRILRREAWEARTHATDCGDEEVASLLCDFASKREALAAELEKMAPSAARPGA